MANILVVEDEILIARLLKQTLEIEGHQTINLLNGEDAVQFALRETPHLIILDIMLPHMDGYEVIRRLRNHPKSMHIPIIVLSALDSPEDKVRAFERDVDDYIIKPFNTDELLARIRRQLRRVQQSFLSPLTGLPGGLQVVRAINYKLGTRDPWSILYLDLDNFKAFNDVYGFLAGNNMILLVGQISQGVVHKYGNADDFVGHIGGDDFVIVTTPDRSNALCSRILSSYKEKSLSLYRQEDLQRGSISGMDRKGRPYQFPLVSLSIGVVSNQTCRLHSIQEVGYLAAEAKRHAKQSTNNIYCLPCRREDPPQEHSTSTGPLSASFLSPAFLNNKPGYPHRFLLHFEDEDLMAEFEHQVY